jgi:hypothetical protein
MEARLSNKGIGGCSSGELHDMVIGGEWEKVKKRYLDMVEARREE